MATLDPERMKQLHRYWCAANYLTVGQIYLRENPLLREPLRPEHIKPRLLGHWGTSPGLSFIYAHLNRLITDSDANVIYLTGPGHGGPAIVANVYLEGTYSEIYPHVSMDTAGLRRLFRQFSTPGGIPSHVSVPTPGSIHEGGELGYVLAHAFGAVFDNPDLIAIAVVGDGEAETGPLEGAWKSIKFLDPARDGAVLPILHLNGYKISGPTVLGRDEDGDVRKLLEAHGYDVTFVETPHPDAAAGDAPDGVDGDPMAMHQPFAQALDAAHERIRAIQAAARGHAGARPRWPAIVLRTPKGWTGPRVVDGIPVEGTFRAHQVPLDNVRDNREHLQMLERWMRSYKPDELFDGNGRFVPDLAALAPRGNRRMGANPHANGGRLTVDLELPDFREYGIAVPKPATERHESTRRLGQWMRDMFKNPKNAFRLFCPDETNSNRLGDVFTVENRCSTGRIYPGDDHLAAQRPRDGGAERAPVPGLARGIFTDRAARPVRDLRGVRDGVGVDDRTAHQVAGRGVEAAVARADSVAEHPADVDLLAQRPQRVLAPGPGPHRHRARDEGLGGAHLSAARRQLLAVDGRIIASAAATTST